MTKEQFEELVHKEANGDGPLAFAIMTDLAYHFITHGGPHITDRMFTDLVRCSRGRCTKES